MCVHLGRVSHLDAILAESEGLKFRQRPDSIAFHQSQIVVLKINKSQPRQPIEGTLPQLSYPVSHQLELQ